MGVSGGGLLASHKLDFNNSCGVTRGALLGESWGSAVLSRLVRLLGPLAPMGGGGSRALPSPFPKPQQGAAGGALLV